LFGQFTQGFGGNQPSLEDALSLVLAAMSLFGLGIFGPGIAAGLTAGAPQLGAGAAVGTVLAAGGLGVAGAMGMRAGAASVGRAAGAIAPARSMAAFPAAATATQSSSSNGPPDWARRMRREQAISRGLSAAAHAVRSGDRGGGSTSVDLKESR
jgi:type IV secretion system protein TrbL